MPDIIDPAERIQRLLDQGSVQISRIFNAAIGYLKDSIDLNELATMLEAGQYEQALETLQEAAQHLGTASQVTFITAGQSTAQFLTGADVARILFDVSNVRAVEAMQQNRLELIRGFSAEQRLAVHATITDGIREGLNPRDQARAFRDVIGLTERQAQAVINYRRLLGQAGQTDLPAADQREALTRALRDGRFDRSVERAVRVGQPLKPEQIDTMVARYADRYVKYRAEVIGRTEALRAVHQGTEEAYNQAIDSGKLRHDQLEHKWVTRLDGRERDSHYDLNGVTRPFGGTFPGHAGDLRYPGDPEAPAEETVQCRCLLTTRIRVR